MATCPNCHTRDGVVIEETDETYWRSNAAPLGVSLPGNRLKFAATSHPIVIIRHPACGLEVRCYVGTDGYVYPIPPAREEGT